MHQTVCNTAENYSVGIRIIVKTLKIKRGESMQGQ